MPKQEPIRTRSGIHAEKGRAAAEAGELPEAVIEFRLALALDPWNKDAQRNLGLALAAKGDLPEAVAAWQRLIILDPHDADAHNSLGSAQKNSGHYQAAMEAFRAALRLNPTAWMPHYNLAISLLERQQIEQAIFHIEKILSLHSQRSEAGVMAHAVLRDLYRRRRRHRLSQKLQWALRRFRRKKVAPLQDAGTWKQGSPRPEHSDGPIECAYNKSGLRMALTAIERDYTEEWLSLDNPGREVQKAWRRARDFVNTDAAEGEPLVDPELAGLVKFATDLSVARSLSGFDADIRPRLKGPDKDMEKVKYEIFVGSVLAQGEHGAEFIPPSSITGVKTADLKIPHPARPIFVECKRKDRYILSSGDLAQEWQPIVDRTIDALADVEASLDVTILVPSGTSPADVEVLLDAVFLRAANGQRGLAVHQPTGIGFVTREIALPAPSENLSIALPARKINQSRTVIKYKKGADGVSYPVHQRRVSVWFLGSHKLRTIIESFNTARRQIPEDGPGIIYIDLDISWLEPGDVFPYLDCMAASIKALFTPNSNTRVGAVVLTTQSIFRPSPSPGGVRTGHEIIAGVVHNMHSEEPVDVPTIPGSTNHRMDYAGQITANYGINVTEKNEPVPPPE